MDKILDALADAARFTAGLFGSNMTIWFIVLGVLIAVWGTMQYLLTDKNSRTDSGVIKELGTFQKVAKGWMPEEKIRGFVGILKENKNYIIWVYYKYTVSHRDFSGISDALTVNEYQNVTGRMKIRVFSWLILVVLLWVGFVNVCSVFDFKAAAIKSDVFTQEGFNAMIVPALFLAAQLAITIVLSTFRHKDYMHKAELLKELRASSPEFFGSLKPSYNQFALAIAKNAAIPPRRHDKIKRIIAKERLIFREELQQKDPVPTKPAKVKQKKITKEKTSEENMTTPEIEFEIIDNGNEAIEPEPVLAEVGTEIELEEVEALQDVEVIENPEQTESVENNEVVEIAEPTPQEPEALQPEPLAAQVVETVSKSEIIPEIVVESNPEGEDYELEEVPSVMQEIQNNNNDMSTVLTQMSTITNPALSIDELLQKPKPQVVYVQSESQAVVAPPVHVTPPPPPPVITPPQQVVEVSQPKKHKRRKAPRAVQKKVVKEAPKKEQPKPIKKARRKKKKEDPNLAAMLMAMQMQNQALQHNPQQQPQMQQQIQPQPAPAQPQFIYVPSPQPQQPPQPAPPSQAQWSPDFLSNLISQIKEGIKEDNHAKMARVRAARMTGEARQKRKSSLEKAIEKAAEKTAERIKEEIKEDNHAKMARVRAARLTGEARKQRKSALNQTIEKVAEKTAELTAERTAERTAEEIAEKTLQFFNNLSMGNAVSEIDKNENEE